MLLILLLASGPALPLELLQMLPPACREPTPGKLAYQEPMKRFEQAYADIMFPKDGNGLIASAIAATDRRPEDKPTEKELEEIAAERKALDAVMERNTQHAEKITAAKKAREKAYDELDADRKKRLEPCQEPFDLACMDKVNAGIETRWLELRKSYGAAEAKLFAEGKTLIQEALEKMPAVAARAKASKNLRMRQHGAWLESGIAMAQHTIVAAFDLELRKQCDDMNTAFLRSRPE